MSRMDQVMQVGEIKESVHYYIEDYAYTYLKKQKGKEKNKYFLYGEIEENEEQKKLYIYGIAEKPKMEQSYFKEYYPIGFLKIKEKEMFWITLKGQEEKITGYFVFYAPNQAMQEYLVDHHEEIKEDKPEEKIRRQTVQEALPVTEIFVPVRKCKLKKNRKRYENENLMYSFGGIFIAMLIVFLLTTNNGQKKIEVFKQVIKETMAGVESNVPEETIVIEETRIMPETSIVEEEEGRKEVVLQETSVKPEGNEKIQSMQTLEEKEVVESEKVSEEKEIIQREEEVEEKNYDKRG